MLLSILSIRLHPDFSEAGFFFYQSEESIQESPVLQNLFVSRRPYFSYWTWITAKSENLHNHSSYWKSPAPIPSEKPPFQPEVTYYPVAKSGKAFSGKGGGGEDALKNIFLTLSRLGLKIKGGGQGRLSLPLLRHWYYIMSNVYQSVDCKTG